MTMAENLWLRFLNIFSYMCSCVSLIIVFVLCICYDNGNNGKLKLWTWKLNWLFCLQTNGYLFQSCIPAWWYQQGYPSIGQTDKILLQ
jgi:hypothetical protein